MFSMDLQRYRLVDLSLTIQPPGTEDRPLEVSLGRLADDSFKMDITRLHTHVGTHVEAPGHFFAGGKLITEMPLESFFGPATLVSIDEPDEHETSAEILQRKIGGLLQPGDILLCRNGIIRSREPLQEIATLTVDSAHWVVQHQVKLLVLDRWFGLGRDVPEVRAVHEVIMGADICIVESVVLDALTQPRCFFMALPVAFALDSSFCRAIALEER